MIEKPEQKVTHRAAMDAEYSMVVVAEPNNDFDFVQLLVNFQRRWKLIATITLIGIILSVVLSQFMSKIYSVSVEVSLPSNYVVTAVSTNGLQQYNATSLFKRYYNKLRSKENFKNFIFEYDYLSRLYPSKMQTGQHADGLVPEVLYSRFANSLEVEILEPERLRKKPIENPTKFSVTLTHSDEALLVELLNHYVAYINDALFIDLSNDQKLERDIKIADFKQQITLLQNSTRTKLEFEVAKREQQNKEKIEVLEQKKQLVIQHAKSDREVRIAKRKEENQKMLNELNQQKQLIIAKAKKDKQSEIAKAQEALSIATSLNIVYPTRLEDLKIDQASVGDAKTNIVLNGGQSLPLYLMGSNYLKTLINTLKERQNDQAFLFQINQLESDIQKIKDDQVLKSLMDRQNDALYLTELNDINNQIELATNDLGLKVLKERLEGQLFIEQIPALYSRIAQLEALALTFNGLSAFTLDQSALLTNKPVTPSRRIYIIGGSIISFLMALVIAMIVTAIAKRRGD